MVLDVVSTSGTTGAHLDHFFNRPSGKPDVGTGRRSHAHRNLRQRSGAEASFSTVTL